MVNFKESYAKMVKSNWFKKTYTNKSVGERLYADYVENNIKMGKLVEEFKEFINNTPPNELAKAWEHAERFKNVGPTVNQFVIDTLFAKLHEITAERDYYRNRIEELEKRNNDD